MVLESGDGLQVAKFAEPGDIDLPALIRAAFFDLLLGAEPDTLVRFLSDNVGLPLAEATEIVGQQNAEVESLMLYVAGRLEQNDRPVEIADDLIRRDWPGEVAVGFVARVQQEIRALASTAAGREQLLAASRRRMLTGFAWFGGGVLVTWFTQHEAEARGGGYAVVAIGAILYGLALVAMGAWRWGQYKMNRSA